MGNEEKQLTLMDLLMELRHDANPEVQRTAMLHEQGREFVTKNRAGIMSGFIKAMRMQNVKQALFYGSLLLRGGMAQSYVTKRLLIDCCEDGVDANTIEYMVKLFKKPVKSTKDQEVLIGAVMICQGVNWWNCEYGLGKTSMLLRAKKVPTPESESIEDLMKDMKKQLFEGGFDNAMLSNAVLRRLRELGQSPHEFHDWLTEACIKKGKDTGDAGLVQAGKAARKVLNASTGFVDGNWQLVLRYMMAMGSAPNALSYTEAVNNAMKYLPLVDKFLDKATEKLQDTSSIELPAWAYDGMHASNKKLYALPDKRFPGSMSGFYNGILQAKKHGRLDPRDQAELDGLEVPEEYLRWFNEWIDEVE